MGSINRFCSVVFLASVSLLMVCLKILGFRYLRSAGLSYVASVPWNSGSVLLDAMVLHDGRVLGLHIFWVTSESLTFVSMLSLAIWPVFGELLPPCGADRGAYSFPLWPTVLTIDVVGEQCICSYWQMKS